ncbi:transcription initiation factor TFIID subunit 4-like isoform X2 [Dermacentor andersoni]|uniref:transcription initiation factor TFIID subunit 4-like isoform X2 n=1 Tax=Dermacentor andersoni TaxID=34620 RepID=UPI002417A65F|nr:transcription initiation factor TFIID subunit 4-like isoform X2 [Dermacentor andersoni]
MRTLFFSCNSKMASAKSLEEMLTTDVDESVVSELVGSLESQLSSSGIHAPNQELSVSSATTNHVNSVPVSDGLQRLQHDGQKHGVAAALANSCPSIVVSSFGKTIATTSHIVGVSSCASSPASSTNTVMVTLPGALPASGYINQVTGTTQQALLNTSLVRPISNSDIKIVYSPQGHFNAANLAAVNNAVIQQRGNVKIQGVPNGSTAIRSSPHTPATTPGLSAIHNLANVASQQTPLIISQPAKPRIVVDPKDPKAAFKPQILIKQEPPAASVGQEFLRCSSPAAGVIQASKAGPQPVSVVTQVVSSPSILPPGVQIVNVNPGRPGAPGVVGQKTLAPRVVIGSPVRLAPQMLAARPGAPSVQRYRYHRPPEHDNTITLQPGMMRGTLLVKTENGQLQVVNVAPSLPPNSSAASMSGAPTYRLQSVQNCRHQTPLVRRAPIHEHMKQNLGTQPVQQLQGRKTNATPMVGTVLQQGQPSINIVPTVPSSTPIQTLGQPLAQQTVTVKVAATTTTASVTQPLTIQTTVANSQSAATTPSQMSPNTAKKKCKNFLSTLIRLASDQPEQVASNVKGLIQGLIDGTIQPEDFTNQLQKELNSSPQPCLVPFLKKSLPYLRHSLMTKELTIEGVRPPPQGAVTLPSTPTIIPNIQQVAGVARPAVPHATTQVRVMTPTTGGLAAQLANTANIQGVLAQHQRLVTGCSKTSLATTIPVSFIHPRPATTVVAPGTKSLLVAKTSNLTAALSPATVGALQTKVATPVPTRTPVTALKEKRTYSSLRDDDDINDVAAMGGVNLVEESQRILASNAEIVGTQIRSCKDENFLFTNPLQRRITSIAVKYGIEEIPSDVVALISHATQERLKTLVQKLGIVAEHRLENIKTDSRYEVTQDVKAQLKFLEELDRLEKKRHEEQEREILLRAAKSRSKMEDPEQLKLKQKAKEMQKAEMEEMRQREANMTALLAIGPRKKLKTENSGNAGAGLGTGSGLSNSFSKLPMRPRVKRVNLKDILFLMEQERDSIHSTLLYKSYLK